MTNNLLPSQAEPDRVTVEQACGRMVLAHDYFTQRFSLVEFRRQLLARIARARSQV